MYFVLQIVVLLVGTNNTQHTADEVAEGILEIVKNIREKLPDAYIVLPVTVFILFLSIQNDPNQPPITSL